jgi:hypothetical protein
MYEQGGADMTGIRKALLGEMAFMLMCMCVIININARLIISIETT